MLAILTLAAVILAIAVEAFADGTGVQPPPVPPTIKGRLKDHNGKAIENWPIEARETWTFRFPGGFANYGGTPLP